MRRILTTLILLLLPSLAQAAISCTVTSTGVGIAYTPNTTLVGWAETFTVTCARNLASDPTTVSYVVKADNGLDPLGQNNRAYQGATSFRYDLFKDAACGTFWKGNNSFAGSMTLSGFNSFSQTHTFYACILLPQTKPAGTYTDTVTMTMTYGTNQTATGTIGVSINTPAVCYVTTPPAGITFPVYAAFGPAVTATSNFGITCTPYLPYTMTLSTGAGVLAGLRYSLTLSTGISSGIGVEQIHTVTGTLDAGQAGTCATATCAGTQLHTLTIAY